MGVVEWACLGSTVLSMTIYCNVISSYTGASFHVCDDLKLLIHFFSCVRFFTPVGGSPYTSQRHRGFSLNGVATHTYKRVGGTGSSHYCFSEDASPFRRYIATHGSGLTSRNGPSFNVCDGFKLLIP